MPRRLPLNTLLASVTDAPAASGAVVLPRTVAPRPPAAPAPSDERRPERLYLLITVATLAVGGLSLLTPSTPSYDPWSWNLWAREIVHGHLTITTSGSSFKPLPMVATIPLALLGGAAPDLWLVIARAGALAALVLGFRLAYRLTRAIGGPQRASIPAALLAGAIAVVAIALGAGSGYLSSNLLGYSEGLATALLLAALELGLDGRHRAAFAVGFLVALDRPEIWLFWVPYGLWLARRDRTMRPAILAAFVVQPIVWFGPVYLGSGHLGASVTRAQHPRANSEAFASIPFVAELQHGAWPMMLLRVKSFAALLVIVVAVAARRRRGLGEPPPPRLRAATTAACLGLGGGAWLALIALMTQLGFSGNDRYLVLGTALIDVCGAVAFGWLSLAVARGLWRASARRRTAGRRSVGRRTAVLTGAALAAALFALVPNWVGGSLVSPTRLRTGLRYQASLRTGVEQAIAAAGGRRRVLACGSVMTEGFQVPMVAYALDVPTTRVLGAPPAGTVPGAAPNLILQTRANRSGPLLPIVRTWTGTRYARRATDGPFNLFMHCA